VPDGDGEGQPGHRHALAAGGHAAAAPTGDDYIFDGTEQGSAPSLSAAGMLAARRANATLELASTIKTYRSPRVFFFLFLFFFSFFFFFFLFLFFERVSDRDSSSNVTLSKEEPRSETRALLIAAPGSSACPRAAIARRRRARPRQVEAGAGRVHALRPGALGWPGAVALLHAHRARRVQQRKVEGRAEPAQAAVVA
jgi:hypothetical protein